MSTLDRRLLVCYVPGLDQRRLSTETTPTIARLLERHGAVEIRTVPNTELVPTLLSGVLPHQNLIWQVSLDADRKIRMPQRLLDALPDLLTTTLQCIRQRFDSDFDLAAIPPWRRRRFVQHRFKYTRRLAAPEIMAEFNGYRTLFGALGEQARYRFTHRFEGLDTLAEELLTSDLKLEFLEMYALDLFQHWHLDDNDRMVEALRKTDAFVARLVEGCAESGQTLVFISDHGQEPVRHSIPLVPMLRGAGVSREDYSYYCELACARFWFHTEDAREKLIPAIERLDNCTLLHFSEMHQYDVVFDDASYGEYYLMADAGAIFFPHDFYQPIANLYLGLVGRSQRSRAFNPVHRGNHGYLPHYPSEKGFLIIADDTIRPNRARMSLIDFAPTMLRCIGSTTPEHMTGSSLV